TGRKAQGPEGGELGSARRRDGEGAGTQDGRAGAASAGWGWDPWRGPARGRPKRWVGTRADGWRRGGRGGPKVRLGIRAVESRGWQRVWKDGDEGGSPEGPSEAGASRGASACGGEDRWSARSLVGGQAGWTLEAGARESVGLWRASGTVG